jgi:hypothetical protein
LKVGAAGIVPFDIIVRATSTGKRNVRRKKTFVLRKEDNEYLAV